MSALGDENVGGLDVAMNDVFAVRGIERVGDFDGEAEQDIHFQRAAGDAMLESQAVEVLHGDEGLAVLFADVVDGADVGMIQGGSRFGLAAKALQGLTDPGRRLREGISGRRSDRAGCLRPCRPRPCRRHRASQRCGSARWFGRSFMKTRIWGLILGGWQGQVNAGAMYVKSRESIRIFTLRSRRVYGIADPVHFTRA